MAFSAFTSRWKPALATAFTLLAVACGDDENGGNPQPNPGGPLKEGIVGKACTKATEAADCAGGRCATEQSFGSTISGILTSLGLSVNLPAPGGYCTADCSSSEDCGPGGICFGGAPPFLDGECRKACTANTDCRAAEGYECAKQAESAPSDAGAGFELPPLPSQCQGLPPAPVLQPNQVGQACSTAADAGALAAATVCGAGYCQGGACTGTCNDNSTCGAGAECVPNGFYGSSGTCRESCTNDADCTQYKPGTGNVGCLDLNGRKLCGTKQFPLPQGVLGDACVSDEACGNGECEDRLSGAVAPDGYCTLANCQDDSVCTGGSCIGTLLGALGSRCYLNCTSNAECRTGYSCQDRTGLDDAPRKVCAPIPVARDAGAGNAALIVGGLDGGV